MLYIRNITKTYEMLSDNFIDIFLPLMFVLFMHNSSYFAKHQLTNVLVLDYTVILYCPKLVLANAPVADLCCSD